MEPRSVSKRTLLPFSAHTVFNWHLQPGAFERLTPPWVTVKVVSKEGGPSQMGSRLVLKVKIGFFWKEWVVQHLDFEEDHYFTDVQIRGPFKFWKHIHKIHPLDAHRCEIEDEVLFIPPFRLFPKWVEKKIAHFLQWRHSRLERDLTVQHKYPQKPLKILVGGARGFIGSQLLPFLTTAGHEVFRLVRRPEGRDEKTVYWNPKVGGYSIEDFEGFDVLINLAGKNIASGRWTKKFKQELVESRVGLTRELVETLKKLKHPPKTLICASAMGYYGDRKEEELTERSSPGVGFLAELTQEWEKTTEELEQVRKVHTRFGVVLSPNGGFLKRILPFFQLGLGAILGKGDQYFSWIALDDVIYGLYHAFYTESLSGGVNFVAPYPETNRSFSQKQ